MKTTRDDLVRWFDAGRGQGFDYMTATDDAEVTPMYWRHEEDGSAALDEEIVRIFAGRLKKVMSFGLDGDRDGQIDRFLTPSPPLPELSPEESKADIRRLLDEMLAITRAAGKAD